MSDNTPGLWDVTAKLAEIVGNVFLLAFFMLIIFAVFAAVVFGVSFYNRKLDAFLLRIRDHYEKYRYR